MQQIDVIDVDPKYYAAIVGYKGKLIENLQNECGATVFTYKHSKARIAKNEQKEKETAEMMLRWKQRRLKKLAEKEKREKDPNSLQGLWRVWRKKEIKDPVKERENIEAQIEKLTNTRKWITPKIDFQKEWENKLMIFGDKESKLVVRKYVNDLIAKTTILPISKFQFSTIFLSANYDKQLKAYYVRLEKRRKKKLKEYRNERLQIRMDQLNVDENDTEALMDDHDEYTQQEQEEQVADLERKYPFKYKYEKLNHDALIEKLQRDLGCILTFDDNNFYISNAENEQRVIDQLMLLCEKHKWRAFKGMDEDMESDDNLRELNRAMVKNKQIRWFLLNPHENQEFKQLLDEHRALRWEWNSNRCDLAFFGLKDVADSIMIDIQTYLQQFKLVKLDNLAANNWLTVPHPTIKETVHTIFEETGVRIFNLKNGVPMLISKDEQNLQIAQELLMNLYESVECLNINPKQLEVAQTIVDELQTKYECDIIINPTPNENQEYTVNIIYHNQQLRDALIDDLNVYLSQHELLRFHYNEHVPHLHLNDFSFPTDWKRTILRPLCTYYDVIVNASNKHEIKILGSPENIQYVNKALTRFCKNIRGLHIDTAAKGPLIQRYLSRYQAQFPSVYFWWDASKQCIWASVLPLAVREQRMYGDKQHIIDATMNDQELEPVNTDTLMTDTSSLQQQFDLFCHYLDHANKNLVSLPLGRHLELLLQPNLPFELDTIEYLNEEKELDELMMMTDDEYSKAMKQKKEEKVRNKNSDETYVVPKEGQETSSSETVETTETRMEMIEKMSNVELSVDEQNNMLYLLGTENQLNVAYDLVKDILQNVRYIPIDEHCAQILTHDYFSTTHGDIEMSHKSILSYISEEIGVTLDVIQAFPEEIQSMDIQNWHENVYKQQVNMATKAASSDSTELLSLQNKTFSARDSLSDRILPDLYVVVYGNELRQQMVKEKLEHYVSTVELDVDSKMKIDKPLEKLNRDQRRLLFDLFRVKRSKKDKKDQHDVNNDF